MSVNNNELQPLVSVVVITYNSSKTVIETLDSIKDQTYQKIELIVSDDCSQDSTVLVCNNWLNDNKSRFVYSEIVTTGKNTGVSGNFNRGISHSHGEWIKSIAGDDMLIPTAIEEYVDYITKSIEKVKMCVCDVELFARDGVVPEKLVNEYYRYYQLAQESYEQQRKRVMTSLVFVGPSFFYSRKLYDEIGGYSDKYGNAEEWPFVYKIIMGGNRIYVIKKKLVRYRVQASSLCHVKDGVCGNQSVFIGMYHHFFDHPFKDLVNEGRLLTAWDLSLSYWSRRIQYHLKDSRLRRTINIIIMMFSPLSLIRKYKNNN